MPVAPQTKTVGEGIVVDEMMIWLVVSTIYIHGLNGPIYVLLCPQIPDSINHLARLYFADFRWRDPQPSLSNWSIVAISSLACGIPLARLK